MFSFQVITNFRYDFSQYSYLEYSNIVCGLKRYIRNKLFRTVNVFSRLVYCKVVNFIEAFHGNKNVFLQTWIQPRLSSRHTVLKFTIQ